MAFNPEVKRAIDMQNELLQTLRKENENLKLELNIHKNDYIHALQQKLQAENQTLQQKSTEDEKRITRLKEVFNKKILEFREIVYLLFGYKVDLKERIYHLRPMYAGQEDEILFCVSGDCQLELLETSFSSKISPEIQELLKLNASIPAFLSSIMVFLFKKQMSNLK